ncbi:hypothetical protein [Amorphus orientalis]|uniref:Uncharacterized protein n=1 Tax=Amorphus orientalis TaxID=649198 RepID=A0AAE3VT44_9HYPH|nr:hypothetical protein [Amorphus orientalis]MDQ0317722.1 hypothetical protein [Amorphus orientalis]
MADPFRLTVLQALTTVIEGVNPDAGFQHDLRGSVFRGRSVYGDNDPLPMVSILEHPDPPVPADTQSDNPMATREWHLLVQGFTKDDMVHPSDASYRLKAEVETVLSAERTREGGRNPLGLGSVTRRNGSQVLEMSIGVGTVRPSDEHPSYFGFFWLPLRLRLVEKLDDPYS